MRKECVWGVYMRKKRVCVVVWWGESERGHTRTVLQHLRCVCVCACVCVCRVSFERGESVCEKVFCTNVLFLSLV